MLEVICNAGSAAELQHDRTVCVCVSIAPDERQSALEAIQTLLVNYCVTEPFARVCVHRSFELANIVPSAGQGSGCG